MNLFQNYLEKLGLSIFPKLHESFPKLLGNFDLLNISKWVWKFFHVVLGNVSCIENAFGTV
jgi:hypothetical protein